MTKNWNFKQWFACNIPWQQYYVSLKRNRNVIDAILILLRYEFLSVWSLLMASLYYLGHLKQPCWSRATLITWRCQLWSQGPVSKSLDKFCKISRNLKAARWWLKISMKFSSPQGWTCETKRYRNPSIQSRGYEIAQAPTLYNNCGSLNLGFKRSITVTSHEHHGVWYHPQLEYTSNNLIWFLTT